MLIVFLLLNVLNWDVFVNVEWVFDVDVNLEIFVIFILIKVELLYRLLDYDIKS